MPFYAIAANAEIPCISNTLIADLLASIIRLYVSVRAFSHTKTLVQNFKMKKGQAKALINEIKHFLVNKKNNVQDTVQTEYNFFFKHQKKGRLDYADFKEQKLPIGSGVVESLIRQVVNIRLKSCSKAWLEENAEAFLHARCQWAVHKWSDFCDNVLTFGLNPLPTVNL